MLAALPRALSQRPYVNKAVGVVSTVYRSVVMLFITFIMIADDEVTRNIDFVRRHSNRRLKSKDYEYLSPEDHFQAAQFACHVRCPLR